jgi:inner membrane protein
MASLGHIAVGMAAARFHHKPVPRWSLMAWWSALSLLPDADVVGFALGVNYGDPWGHRGATHSLTFSVALGLAVGLAARWFKRPASRTALIASAVLASHAILDTMTDGGLGCALFWPFDLTRYFAPWRPIPVAPIGLRFFSPHGATIALTELVLFSPLLLFALRSRRNKSKRLTVTTVLFLAFWGVAVWLISGTARDAIVGFLLREDTAYASGFSEESFRTIARGESDNEVQRLLGAPLREIWVYTPENQPFQPAIERSALSLPRECLVVRFEAGVVVTALDLAACRRLGIETGMSLVDVDRLLGSPPEKYWQYSWSPGETHFRLRALSFMDGRVTMVIRQWQH